MVSFLSLKTYLLNTGVISLKPTPGSAEGLIKFDVSGKLRLWTGRKGLVRKKHRPFQFRISNCGFRILGLSFSIRIPQSTFRNSVARPNERITALG